jgi:hypothetical protein
VVQQAAIAEQRFKQHRQEAFECMMNGLTGRLGRAPKKDELRQALSALSLARTKYHAQTAREAVEMILGRDLFEEEWANWEKFADEAWDS